MAERDRKNSGVTQHDLRRYAEDMSGFSTSNREDAEECAQEMNNIVREILKSAGKGALLSVAFPATKDDLASKDSQEAFQQLRDRGIQVTAPQMVEGTQDEYVFRILFPLNAVGSSFSAEAVDMNSNNNWTVDIVFGMTGWEPLRFNLAELATAEITYPTE